MFSKSNILFFIQHVRIFTKSYKVLENLLSSLIISNLGVNSTGKDISSPGFKTTFGRSILSIEKHQTLFIVNQDKIKQI